MALAQDTAQQRIIVDVMHAVRQSLAILRSARNVILIQSVRVVTTADIIIPYALTADIVLYVDVNVQVEAQEVVLVVEVVLQQVVQVLS